MISMQDINAALKENFQLQLSEVTDLPTDLATGYRQWVQGLVQTAGQQLSAEQHGAQASQEQTQEQPAQQEA